jgi:hypothetical protein
MLQVKNVCSIACLFDVLEVPNVGVQNNHEMHLSCSVPSNMHLTAALFLLSTIAVHVCPAGKLPQHHPGSMQTCVRGLAGLIKKVSVEFENCLK